MKKTLGKVGRVMGRMATNTILVQPIRILIIINSIFLPLLLGILVFIILKYAQDIKDIIDKAKKIENMVEDNIKLGIQKIREGYAQAQNQSNTAAKFANEQITKLNTKKFIKNTLLEPLILYINPSPKKSFTTDEFGMGTFELEEGSTLLDVSGHSVNKIIESNTGYLKGVGCTQQQIDKVLKENRSIAYILTHNKLNN